MKSLKQYKNEINELNNLHNLVSVYQEIAASQIKETRDSILQARDFTDGLHEIHKVVQITSPELDHEPKKLAIFLSANARLHGAIVYDTFRAFRTFVKDNPDVDTMIFGKLGEQLAGQSNLKVDHSFRIEDSHFDFDVIGQAAGAIFGYDIFHLFHGQFMSLAHQEPTATHIFDKINDDHLKEISKRYLFEPTREQIQDLFKSELIVSLLSQTFREAHLAKQGSRFLQLDSATQSIGENIERSKKQMLLFRKNLESKKQSTRVSRLRRFKG